MLLSKIHLHNFRNFENDEFDFSPFLTLIVGDNAHGKTSLLEGIYTGVLGRGFRETREVELIRWEQPHAIVEIIMTDKDSKIIFQVKLQRAGEDRVEKTFYVSKSKKSYYQYKQLQTKAVLFSPELINLIKGSPSRRRRSFDDTLSVIDKRYGKHLRNYENALRQRNKILENFIDENSLASELAFWNKSLATDASYISMKRAEYVDYLNKYPKVDGKEFSIQYKKDECTSDRLIEVFPLERRLRRTTIGPQKDDYVIYLHDKENKKDIHLYGSRSEQRLAVFWLKLNEIRRIEEIYKVRPVLLLDDVFSELDQSNKSLVMRVIKGYQTVITTTEDHIDELAQMPEAVIRL